MSMEREIEIYIYSSRLGLIKMDQRHPGNGHNSQQQEGDLTGPPVRSVLV